MTEPPASAAPVAEVPHGAPERIDATAGRAAAAVFGAASFVRLKRSLHPDGVGFEAVLVVDRQGTTGSRLLDRPDEHRCAVRFSRAIGLPERVRDVLGLAVRVLDDGGQARQDLLFSSVIGEGGFARHVLAPSRSFVGLPLSSVLPYRTPGGVLTLLAIGEGTTSAEAATLEDAAHAFAAGDLVFAVHAAGHDGNVRVGHLCGGPQLPASEAESLRFNPYHAEPDLQPTGTLNALRRRAYAASQRGRAARRGGSPG